MKSLELKNKALSSENSEYIFGFEDTGSHACYMIYGTLKPEEVARLVKPGSGHEELSDPEVMRIQRAVVVDGDLLEAGFEAQQGQLRLETVGLFTVAERTHLQVIGAGLRDLLHALFRLAGKLLFRDLDPRRPVTYNERRHRRIFFT